MQVVTRRVLYVHGIAEIGGAERDLLAILATLDRTKWEPHVVCPAAGPLYDALQQAAIAAHPLSLAPWRKWYSPLVRWLTVRHLRSLLVRLSPAIVHVNDIWWVPHTLQAVKGLSVEAMPVVAHVRQEIEPKKVQSYGLNRTSVAISISRQVEQAIAGGGVPSDRVRTIYSGLDFSPPRRGGTDRGAIRARLGLSADAVLIGTVANLFPRKGYEIMVRALPAVLAACPSVHYVAVGNNQTDYARTLMKFAEELGVAARLHIVGFQDDVRPFLDALDLYVHPALMEGFGIAVVEAMAAGKAVVATSTGGLPEVVDHERTGLLVAPGDPIALGRAVVSLIQNPPRLEEMGRRGVVRAKQLFDLHASVKQIVQVYESLLSTHRA